MFHLEHRNFIRSAVSYFIFTLPHFYFEYSHFETLELQIQSQFEIALELEFHTKPLK